MFPPPPPLPTPPPRRFVKFGGYLICSACGYAEEFCGCQKPPSPPAPGDGAESSLIVRIREAQGGR